MPNKLHRIYGGVYYLTLVMAYFRVIITLKQGKEKKGIREYDKSYPWVLKEVTEKANTAYPGNIKEILVFRLPADHPAIQDFIKQKLKK